MKKQISFKKMNKVGAGLRPFVINLILCAVFALFIIFFALGFINTMNPSSQIIAKNHLNTSLNNLNKSISDFSDRATDVYTQMGSSQPSATDYLFLIFQGAFTIPISFLGFGFSAIGNITNVLFISLGGGLFGGIATIMLGLVSSILVITLVLYIVKNIRSGESDH